MKAAGGANLTYSSDNIPYRKLWEALSWATDAGCVTLEQLAGLVRDGRYGDLVRACELFYEAEVSAAAEKILSRGGGLRCVIMAGPSSSGKTTTTMKISGKLAAAGIRTALLCADNYFLDRENQARVGDDYDYETPQALDLALLNAHVKTLIDGGEVEVPRYNFKTGRRDGTACTLALDKGQALLLDSLHGLFPALTESVPEAVKARVYIEALSVLKDRNRRFIRWADVRLLRRMARDMQFRGSSPRDTVRHWHLVRRGEMRWIVPQLTEAHAIVNSFLPYELPIMKRRIESYVEPLVEEFRAEGGDALERMLRVREMLAELPAAEDEGVVPEDSLLREFIGGSRLPY